jgi:cystathionine beta-lyase/cystathionine gamma-synthase
MFTDCTVTFFGAMTEPFSAESRLVHAGTERMPGRPATPGLLADLRAWRSSGGGIPGPFEAWLALRGLKRLPLRIARRSATAPAGLIRLSVGVEPAADLITDIDHALEVL